MLIPEMARSGMAVAARHAAPETAAASRVAVPARESNRSNGSHFTGQQDFYRASLSAIAIPTIPTMRSSQRKLMTSEIALIAGRLSLLRTQRIDSSRPGRIKAIFVPAHTVRTPSVSAIFKNTGTNAAAGKRPAASAAVLSVFRMPLFPFFPTGDHNADNDHAERQQIIRIGWNGSKVVPLCLFVSLQRKPMISFVEPHI